MRRGPEPVAWSQEARKPLASKQVSARYQIDDGKLKLVRAKARTTAPAAKVTVLMGDKAPRERALPDKAVTPLHPEMRHGG